MRPVPALSSATGSTITSCWPASGAGLPWPSTKRTRTPGESAPTHVHRSSRRRAASRLIRPSNNSGLVTRGSGSGSVRVGANRRFAPD
jgi:hypothetical protein